MKTKTDRPASGANCLAVVLAALALQCNAQPVPGTSYSGMVEASAAAMVNDRHFVVAEDECNTLLVYARGQSKPIGAGLDLAEFLETADKASDIEGGAIIGDIVYWISSHSLPKSGKPRDWRKQFFATRVSTTGATTALVTPPAHRSQPSRRTVGRASGRCTMTTCGSKPVRPATQRA